MSQLAALPEGAGYSARSGQATATVLRGQGDTLIITSTCDSLAREVIALREELIRIRNETGETVEEPPPQVVQERYLPLPAPVITGISQEECAGANRFPMVSNMDRTDSRSRTSLNTDKTAIET